MRFLDLPLAAACIGVSASAVGALEFNFIPQPGTSTEAIEGFAAAGRLWSERLHDDMVVNVSIGFEPLQTGVLGSTGSERVSVSLADYAAALEANAQSDLDTETVATFGGASDVAILINRTSDSPNGSGSAVPFVDDDGSTNNRTVQLTRATAKALDLVGPFDTGIDASISFNSDFNWDFDPQDGISPNHFSYIAVAAHEIGHALGFVSGVDILDLNSPPGGGTFASDQFAFVSPADLFRYSGDSRAAGAIDWTADTRAKSFASGPAAPTDGALFSLGRNQGDGQQASHWKDNLGIGLMDPTAAPGEDGQITMSDIALFDAIGYETTAADGVTVACHVADLAIPDAGAAVTSRFDPGLATMVTDLQVDLEIAHTWVGDLELRIIAPDGTSALLLDRPGRGASGFGCGADDVLVRLSDDGLAPAEEACAATGEAAISGALTPVDSLAGFAGAAGSGAWELRVQDHVGQDSGTLLRWCIGSDSDAPRFASSN
ncbi:NF038122 family metalloprotease [Marinibacterium sp. SX1]|uniref:NF038122 family metalloprotease n=1 Tax=Marinibacterium sp. SX1 TaxID=3388424 RepID=UPI003D17056D